VDKSTALRSLPAVHKILSSAECQALLHTYSAALVSQALAEVLDDLRSSWDRGDGSGRNSSDSGDVHVGADDANALADSVRSEGWARQISPVAILAQAAQRLEAKFAPRLREVLNLTGVVIHTNLGRAPLSQRAIDAVCKVAAGYSNLEYDLAVGARGTRHSHIETRICDLTGAEAALVVNNNAAAVVLVLRELCSGGEAIVSRGELVEIGGSFRVPDIMQESGVQLVEVGSTNKTRISDYESAISPATKMIVKVHTSNFRIVGFTEQPDLANLVAMSHAHGVPVFEDLGSGALFDYRARGVGDEPTIRSSVAAGVDIVSFSGDKLLGGAQAGIVIGRRAFIDRMKKNPLMRALRPDKMTLAALEATLVGHVDDVLAQQEIPVVRMLTMSALEADAWARTVMAGVQANTIVTHAFTFDCVADVSRIGGGALPTETLPTTAIHMRRSGWSTQTLYDKLRTVPTVPIVARISDDRVLLDVRTLLPQQIAALTASLQEVAEKDGGTA